MKKIMKGFYNPSDEEMELAWNSEYTLFIFDTNTLLNLYEYADKTKSDFFSVMEKIKNRVWIPYHVALEYQRRRLGVIKAEKQIFKKVKENLEKINSVFSKDFRDLQLGRRIPSLAESTVKLESEIKNLIEQYQKNVDKLDNKQLNVNGLDSIRSELDTFFDEKVGDKPESQQWLNSLYTEGKERFLKKFPPGYKDSPKGKSDDSEFMYADLKYDRQYGDLIIWKQIIKKVSDEKIESVIFITDDSKEDWWQIEESSGTKTIGPRPELIEEIRSEALIESFIMYKTSDFLAAARKTLKVVIDISSVTDAENISESVNTEINETLSSLKSIAFSNQIDKLRNSIYPQSLIDRSIESERSIRNEIIPQNTIDQLIESERSRRIGNIPQSAIDQFIESEQNAKNEIFKKSAMDQYIETEINTRKLMCTDSALEKFLIEKEVINKIIREQETMDKMYTILEQIENQEK